MKSIEDQFWSRIDRSGECWLWTGKKNTYHYPILCHQGEQIAARRYSYELAKGEFKGSLKVICNCGERSCVNPDHLFLGTLGHKAKYKTKVFPTNNIEILAAAVCSSCGGPRSVYSAERCIVCYLAKAKSNRYEKARLKVFRPEIRLGRQYISSLKRKRNRSENLILAACRRQFRFNIWQQRFNDRAYAELWLKQNHRRSQIRQWQHYREQFPWSMDYEFHFNGRADTRSLTHEWVASSELSPAEALMRKEEREEEQKYRDFKHKRLNPVDVYRPALVYAGTLSRIDPRPKPLPSEFGRDAQRMYYTRKLNGNGS